MNATATGGTAAIDTATEIPASATGGGNALGDPPRRWVRRLVVAAGIAATIAVLAGAALWAFAPTAGSTTEGALGLTAAITGLATGFLAAGAAIAAAATGGWARTPKAVRYAAWALLAIALSRSIWSQLLALL